MPLNARRHIRKMRGGAQSHLIEADNGRCYVVKFRNNPQHRRILINEIVSSVFLRNLQLSAPEAMVISVSEEFLRENPDVRCRLERGAYRPNRAGILARSIREIPSASRSTILSPTCC